MNTIAYRGWTAGLGAVQSIVASAGVMSTAIGQGDSLVVSLPAGSTWLIMPVAPGAAVSGGTVGTSEPATFSGLRAGTFASLSWTDAAGVPQTAALNITVNAAPPLPPPGPPMPAPPPGPSSPAAASTGMSTGTVIAIGVGVVAVAGLLYLLTRPKVVASSTPRTHSRYR